MDRLILEYFELNLEEIPDRLRVPVIAKFCLLDVRRTVSPPDRMMSEEEVDQYMLNNELTDEQWVVLLENLAIIVKNYCLKLMVTIRQNSGLSMVVDKLNLKIYIFW